MDLVIEIASRLTVAISLDSDPMSAYKYLIAS